MYRITVTSKLFEILQQVCRLLLSPVLFNITSTEPTIIPKFGLRQLSLYRDKLRTARFGARTLGGTRPDRSWGPFSHRLQGESLRGVARNTHPQLGPKLRKGIAKPVLPLCACMARYRKNFILPTLFRHRMNGVSIKCIKFAKKQRNTMVIETKHKLERTS
jgi:hypothetical protein